MSPDNIIGSDVNTSNKILMEQHERIGELCTDFALVAKDIEYIKKEIVHVNEKLENHYVTRIEFEPVKRVVYGLVGLILTTVILALIGLVVMK